MRAIGLRKFGGPEVLEAVELPDPSVRRDEVRIRVYAATVNRSDVLLREGALAAALAGVAAPWVPGWEVAGVIDMIGPDVSRLSVGDHVMAIVQPARPGGYAELVVTTERSVVPQPRGAGHVASATLPMNGLTAMRAVNLLALQPGQWLAVTGAVGAVGGYAVQLAKHAGLRVVADAAIGDRSLAEALGADIILDRGAGLADRIRERVPEGVAGLVDTAGMYAAAFPAIIDGGGYAAVRPWEGEPDRGIRLHRVLVRECLEATDMLERLRALSVEGALSLRVAETLPAAEAGRAHERLSAGGVRGRMVLEF